MNEIKEMLRYPKRQREFMTLLYGEIKDLPRHVQLEVVSHFKESVVDL